MTSPPPLSPAIDTRRLEALVSAHRTMPGALLPLLHAIQDEFGHVPEQAVAAIARGLDLSRAEVHGVLSFYPHFRRQPPSRHVLQLCRAEACLAMGAVELEAHAHRALAGCHTQTGADAQVSLEAVYCLGNCALAPSLRIDDDILGRMTPERFDQLLADLRTRDRS